MREKENKLISLAKHIMQEYPSSSFTVDIREQYRNMKQVLDEHPHIISYAIEALKNIGVEPKITSIRGGTDGAKLSFMGLPCANLFTGMMAIHSKKEFVSMQDMYKSFETVKEIISLIVKKNN
ncbi:MAG: M20/M25/M40 family metallo-hydrolase [Chitinophagaceae bacterium]